MHFVFWDVTIKKFYTSFQDHGDIGGKPTTSVELTVAINLFKARCLKHLTNARKSIDYELEKLMVSIKELQRSWVRVPGPNEARITPTAVQEHPCELSKYHPSFLHSPRQIKNLFFVGNSPTPRVRDTGSPGFLSTIIRVNTRHCMQRRPCRTIKEQEQEKEIQLRTSRTEGIEIFTPETGRG